MEEVSSPSKTVKSKRVVFSDLDVVKFLMAFLVVEIHTRPFGISSLVPGYRLHRRPVLLYRIGIFVLSGRGCRAIL